MRDVLGMALDPTYGFVIRRFLDLVTAPRFYNGIPPIYSDTYSSGDATLSHQKYERHADGRNIATAGDDKYTISVNQYGESSESPDYTVYWGRASSPHRNLCYSDVGLRSATEELVEYRIGTFNTLETHSTVAFQTLCVENPLGAFPGLSGRFRTWVELANLISFYANRIPLAFDRKTFNAFLDRLIAFGEPEKLSGVLGIEIESRREMDAQPDMETRAQMMIERAFTKSVEPVAPQVSVFFPAIHQIMRGDFLISTTQLGDYELNWRSQNTGGSATVSIMEYNTGNNEALVIGAGPQWLDGECSLRIASVQSHFGWKPRELPDSLSVDSSE